MALIDKDDLKSLYTTAIKDAREWKEDYPEYERLANNELREDLDPNLPETNDGSLAAALFKLPKRIINRKLTGRFEANDRNEEWVSELANIQWEKQILPNANSVAPFHRKWKDAVRKAGIYGGIPLITLFGERGTYTGSDFFVAYAQDVTLEPGKVSDNDSDYIFWDIYYSKGQIEDLIEQAKSEKNEAEAEKRESFNTWDVEALQAIIDGDEDDEERESELSPKELQEKSVKKGGIKLVVCVQRGVDAPFYMFQPKTGKTVREWTNPDPTGDVPIHYLYCYQDFINPYGIGIVRLAGGTQNVLDYMRQADILATQIGIRPPISVKGDTSGLDLDSLVYTQDALWLTGNATVEKQELGNQIYSQLPERIGMYKTSLNQMLPTGDTSIGAASGDPNYSKTPAGVKFQQANLSIDDQDFRDNVNMTFEAVSRSMLNTHFANMHGSDLMNLSTEEKEILTKAGLDVENEDALDIEWDKARATFDFTVDPDSDKAKDDATQLEGLSRVVELISTNELVIPAIQQSGKKINAGELFAALISKLTDNDKIVTDIPADEQQAMAEQQAQPQIPEEAQALIAQAIESGELPEEIVMRIQAGEVPPEELMAIAETAAGEVAKKTQAAQASPMDDLDPQSQVNLQAVMDEHGVDEDTAATMLLAEEQGLPPGEIVNYVKGMK